MIRTADTTRTALPSTEPTAAAQRYTTAPRISLTGSRVHFARSPRSGARGTVRMRLTGGLVRGR